MVDRDKDLHDYEHWLIERIECIKNKAVLDCEPYVQQLANIRAEKPVVFLIPIEQARAVLPASFLEELECKKGDENG